MHSHIFLSFQLAFQHAQIPLRCEPSLSCVVLQVELAKKREAAKAAAEARERKANQGWLSWCVMVIDTRTQMHPLVDGLQCAAHAGSMVPATSRHDLLTVSDRAGHGVDRAPLPRRRGMRRKKTVTCVGS